MKAKFRSTMAIAALTAFVITGLFVPAASAGNGTVSGGLSGDPVNPGEQATLTFTISPSQRTLASFTLTPPADWQVVAGSPAPGAPTFQVVGNTLVASGLSVSPSGSATVQFGVKTGCASGSWTWGLVARDSQGRIYGNGTIDLSTQVTASCSLGFVSGRQPANALKNSLITATAFDPASTDFVQVQLLNGASQVVTYFPVDVTFDLATGAGLATGSLSAATKTTVNGVATFGPGPATTLQISTLNEPLYSDFKLKPKTVGAYAGLTGANSTGFDIWEKTCSGSGCSVSIRNDNDTYTGTDSLLTASSLSASSVTMNLNCPGQTLIFANSVFVHETNGTAPVFLKSHVTRADMKAVANNGQAHVSWCLGLKVPGPWNFTQQDTNGSGAIDAADLYVGEAPACPNHDPQDFAPCITRQYGDGNGGSWTEGYVPGGDPPRRS